MGKNNQNQNIQKISVMSHKKRKGGPAIPLRRHDKDEQKRHPSLEQINRKKDNTGDPPQGQESTKRSGLHDTPVLTHSRTDRQDAADQPGHGVVDVDSCSRELPLEQKISCWIHVGDIILGF